MARIEGSGVTRYVIELNNAFKRAGHEVEIAYVKAHDKAELENNMQTINNIVEYDYSDETVAHFNEADFVLVNSIMSKKADQKYHDLWMDLVMNRITTRKAIVSNDRNVLGFNAYYGPLLHNKEFWLAFNKIIIFSDTDQIAKKIKETCGEKEFARRYVQLLHPYSFDESVKETWVPVKNKIRRVTYLGRHAIFKDPERLLRGRDKFYEHGYELEMRGIKRTINVSTVPDLLYSFDDEGNRMPSVATILVDKKWREANNIALDDPMIYTPRVKNKCYVFDAYNRNEGLAIMSKSAYGCNFFNLANAGCYGDNYEYSTLETIDVGTIPLLDYNAGNAIFMYDNKMNNLGKSSYEKGFGIFLKKDLSNIDECLDKMDWLLNNPAEYDSLRNEMFDAFKNHCDPVGVANKLLKDCFNDNIEKYGEAPKIDSLF